jgi:hypothetical protein
MQFSHDEVGNIPWLIYDGIGDGVWLIYVVSGSCIQFILMRLTAVDGLYTAELTVLLIPNTVLTYVTDFM